MRDPVLRSNASSLGSYVRRVVSYAPGKVTLLVILMALAGVCEGLSFTLFIPLIRSMSSAAQSMPLAEDAGILTSTLTNLGERVGFKGLLLIVLFVFAAKNLFLYLQKLYASSLALSFERDTKRSIASGLLSSDWRFYLTEKSGTILNAIGQQAKLAADAFRMFSLMCLEILNVALYCVLGASLAPGAFLLSLASGGVIFFLLRKYMGRSRVIGTEAVQIRNETVGHVLEDFTGIKFIKGNHLEGTRQEKLFSIFDRLLKVELKGERFAATMDTLPDFLMAGVVCLILFVARERLNVPGENLLVLIMVLYRMNRRLIAVQNLRQRLYFYLPSFDLCTGLIGRSSSFKETSGSVPFKGLGDSLTIENVDFSYDGHKVLHSLSMEVKRRGLTALVGRSGSGKTTIVDLALGLLRPDAGAVRIDGTDLRDMDLSSWRERIGYVPQDVLLVNGSIEENIRLGCPGATREEVREAARLAYAHDFIEKQPDGYQTLVGDRGTKLSGGQRQRIALARALVRKPEVLFLDEATSALDQESERMVQNAIEGLRGKLTLLVVAHRLSTIENADRIYVLDMGQVVQVGRADKLKREEGLFRELYAIT